MKLTKQEFAKVSIMLFGLFFGAGNLIFPPLVGRLAGPNVIITLLAFSITAVIFPIFGVIAVSKTKGLNNLGNRVGPLFSIIYTTVIYLSIGPGLGIPRAGSVPFNMSITPFLSDSTNIVLARLIYTFIFFGIAFLISINPNKLVTRMGKYLTPALLIFMIILFIGSFVSVESTIAPAAKGYDSSPIIKGFLDGYNTMDAIAALNFGLVIHLTLGQLNVKSDKSKISYTHKSGLVAGTILFVIYLMLALIGSRTSGMFSNIENGAQVLLNASQLVFGQFGAILIITIFTLACLTTCIGLITSGSKYFETLFKNKLSYKTWAIIWTFISFVFANFGLDTILSYSVPVLIGIYPVSLLLIILALTQKLFKYGRATYRASAFIAIFIPCIEIFSKYIAEIPGLTELTKSLPLYNYSLHWVLPTLVILVIFSIFTKKVTEEEWEKKAL